MVGCLAGVLDAVLASDLLVLKLWSREGRQ